MRLQNTFLFCDLGQRHFGEGVGVFLDLCNTKVKNLGHRQTFRGTNGRAKSTETALGHVNVEFRGVNPLWSPVGCFSNLFYRANRLYLYTVDRADLCALVAHNAVVDLIVKTVSAVIRNRLHFVRILHGIHPFRPFKVVYGGDDHRSAAGPGFVKVSQRQFEADPKRMDRIRHVSPV